MWRWWNSTAGRGGGIRSRVQPRTRRYEPARSQAGVKPPVPSSRECLCGLCWGPREHPRARGSAEDTHRPQDSARLTPVMGDHSGGYGPRRGQRLAGGAWSVRVQESRGPLVAGLPGTCLVPSSEVCQPGRLAAAWMSGAFWGSVTWAHRLSSSGSEPQRTSRSSP